MKKYLLELQLGSHRVTDGNRVDREVLLFQWCTGESIAHLAREYSLPYHRMYRIIKND